MRDTETWMATDRIETGGPRWRSIYIGVLVYAIGLIVVLALFSEVFA